MPKEVQFTEEELKQVKAIQSNYVSIQQSFGQLKLAQIKLDNDEIAMEEALKQIQDEEQKFIDTLTKKYGDGNLNPETGVFTPSQTPNKS